MFTLRRVRAPFVRNEAMVFVASALVIACLASSACAVDAHEKSSSLVRSVQAIFRVQALLLCAPPPPSGGLAFPLAWLDWRALRLTYEITGDQPSSGAAGARSANAGQTPARLQ